MAETPEELEKRRLSFLEKEYSTVESKWRFLQGLRYAVLGSSAAGLTSLYALFVNALSGFQGPLPHTLGRYALTFIPVLALFLMGAISRLEVRLRALYSECSERGAQIERKLGIPTVFSIFLRERLKLQ